MMIGMRVVRGCSWKWNDQDGGEGHVGTVVQIESESIPKHTVLVHWDSGKRSNYCTGHKSLYDLYVLDSAPAGVKHMRFGCCECNERMIRGTRWKCVQCEDVNLCTRCYMKALHTTRHRFHRYDTSSAEPEAVEPRSNCNQLQSYGFYKGAKVVRGHNWKSEWGNQDGGAGKQGTILSISGHGSENDYSVALVEWENGKRDRYRIGHNGKVDLKCVEPAKGMLYYRSHLAQCGKPVAIGATSAPTSSSSNGGFKVGNRVRFTLPDDVLKGLLINHGGWTDKISQFRGQTGVINRITERGDVRVEYKSIPHGMIGGKPEKFTFHPAALELVEDDPSNLTSVIITDHSLPSTSLGESTTSDEVDVINHFNISCRITDHNLSSSITANETSYVDEASSPSRKANLSELHRTTSGPDSLLRPPHEGQFPVHAAVSAGKDSLLLSLKDRDVDMNERDTSGRTVLHHVVSRTQLSTMRVLVEKCGADVNARDNEGCTPLHAAVDCGNISVVKKLLELNAQVNLQDANGNTALHRSVLRDDAEMTLFLCSVPSILLTIRNKRDMTSLHEAAIKGNTRIVEVILNASPSLLNAPGEQLKRSSLHLSAFHGHIDTVRHLIRQGCTVDSSDVQGNSPLQLACKGVSLSCVEALVEGGASVEHRNRKNISCLDILQAESGRRSILVPNHDPYPQIKEILTFNNLISNGTCDVALLAACYLAWKGASTSNITNDQWRNSLSQSAFSGHTKKSRRESSCEPEDVKSLKEEVKALNEKVSEYECQICMDRPLNVLFRPCNHRSCELCSLRLNNCHICRGKIEEKIPMY